MKKTLSVKRYLLLEEEVEKIVFANISEDFKILKIDRVGEKIFLYTLEEEGKKKKNVKFHLLLTNELFEDTGYIYVDSYNSKKLSMTFHVFLEN